MLECLCFWPISTLWEPQILTKPMILVHVHPPGAPKPCKTNDSGTLHKSMRNNPGNTRGRGGWPSKRIRVAVSTNFHPWEPQNVTKTMVLVHYRGDKIFSNQNILKKRRWPWTGAGQKNWGCSGKFPPLVISKPYKTNGFGALHRSMRTLLLETN